jgi:uncharacterized protein
VSADAAGKRRGSLLAGTGAAGGFFSGITGVGGGAIMVPLLTGILGMPQHRAHGTSLVVIAFAAVAGVAVYAWSTSIDPVLTAMLLVGSMGGAYIGARGASRIPAMRLRQVFGIFLLLTAARLLAFDDPELPMTMPGWAVPLFGALVGLVGGIAAGALGIGGGAIFVPGMVILLGAGQHEAQGVSLAVIVLTASVGALTHYRHGTVDVRAAGWIVPASLPAGAAGALVAAFLDAATLQRIFAAVILAVGVQMVMTATLRIRREGRLQTPGGADVP